MASNILVIQMAFPGDMVLTTPLFRALKRLHPEARLTLMASPRSASLVEEDPWLDEVIIFDKKTTSIWAMGKELCPRGFDLVISPHRSHRTSLLAYLSRAPVRVGFDGAGFGFLHNRRVVRLDNLHEVDKNLTLLHGIDEAPEDSDRVLHVGYTGVEKAAVQAVLDSVGVPPGANLIGMSPGSVWATKRYPADRFAQVGRALVERGYRIVLLGGPDDQNICAEVAALIGDGAYNVAGTTGLKALAAWIDRLALLVANDSAPLHVAAARDIPAVAIFGPTVRELGFYPFHEKSVIVEAEFECRPCGLHGHVKCPEDHFNCMLEIAPEKVLQACVALLESGEGQR
jgi:heptosyltransferase-2